MSGRRQVKPVQQPSKLIPAVLAVAIVAAGFTMLMVRLEVTAEGYRLSTLRTEIRGLEDENRTLRLKDAELGSHQRLRKLASRYGLQPPAPGQVVMVP